MSKKLFSHLKLGAFGPLEFWDFGASWLACLVGNPDSVSALNYTNSKKGHL